MAYITHQRQHVGARLSLLRLAALGLNLFLWAAILAGVERCFRLM